MKLPARRPLPVLCAGLYSSGSTWLFNVVAELYRAAWRGTDRTVGQFFANQAADLPDMASLPDALVIKTHAPDKPLRLVAAVGAAPVLITVREPRDAIVSLTTRFKVDFSSQVRGFLIGTERIAELAATFDALVLRFEDRFYDDPATVARVAAFLGLDVAADDIARIAARFEAEAVRRHIAALERQGVFGPEVNPLAFEPGTQWHPGHVGDRAIGKFARMLSPEQQAFVLDGSRRYRDAFGYLGLSPPADCR
jgi:hypothetical protein